MSNGSFEVYSICPGDISDPSQTPYEIERCNDWKAPTFGTSDYFNSCSVNPSNQTPSNAIGIQEPFDGNAYLGFATIFQTGSGTDGYTGPMWWEYVQGKLIAPLETGKIYKLSLQISLADYSDLMITELGIYFSADPLSTPNSASLSVTPQCVFYNANYFSDVSNWVRLESLFVAAGNEEYITIGNFRDNVTTDTLRRNNGAPANAYTSYFYVDNVNLVEAVNNVPNVFTPDGDGINDLWELTLLAVSGENTLTIMNRWGNVVYESELNGFSWDGKAQNGDDVSEGVYFYRISNTNIAGFIELIR